jgi:hypothetical protein
MRSISRIDQMTQRVYIDWIVPLRVAALLINMEIYDARLSLVVIYCVHMTNFGPSHTHRRHLQINMRKGRYPFGHCIVYYLDLTNHCPHII